MRTFDPAAHACGDCPLKHYPTRLLPGIDELGQAIDCFGAVADLVQPVVDGCDLHLVDRGNFASLLALIEREAKWHLRRAEAEYFALKKEAA